MELMEVVHLQLQCLRWSGHMWAKLLAPVADFKRPNSTRNYFQFE
jgi:hypothetical protein